MFSPPKRAVNFFFFIFHQKKKIQEMNEPFFGGLFSIAFYPNSCVRGVWAETKGGGGGGGGGVTVFKIAKHKNLTRSFLDVCMKGTFIMISFFFFNPILLYLARLSREGFVFQINPFVVGKRLTGGRGGAINV